MRSTAPLALVMLFSAAACCGAPPRPPEPPLEPRDPMHATDPTQPGPLRPLEPDTALDAAPPIDVRDASMPDWIAARLANARADVAERVRLPLVRRDPLGCGCPPFAIGAAIDGGPHHAVAVRDLTSIGIPHAPAGWVGWVDARFTGATDVYRGADGGAAAVALPVIEVYRQSRRGSDEDPVARVAPGR